MDRRCKFFAFVFMFMFALSASAFIPQALGAPAQGSEIDVATGVPTYTYGSSLSGTYTNTQVSDSLYHVSISAVYTISTPTETDNAIGVNWVGGYEYSGSYTNTAIIDSIYHVAASSSSGLLCYYTYSFTKGKANVTAISWSVTGYTVSVDSGIFVYNFNTLSWVDTGKSLSHTLGVTTQTGTVSTDYMSSSGEMRIGFNNPTIFLMSVHVDQAIFQVVYNNHAYRINYYYPFRFTGGTPNTVTSMTWTAKGKTNTSTVNIALYNWINSVWDAIGAFNSTDKTYSATADRNYYMQSSNGSMRMRFSQTAQASPFTVSVDYLAFTIVYNIAGSPSYGSVVPSVDPIYANGSLTSGGIWQTRTLNNSYQVSTSGISSYYYESAARASALAYGSIGTDNSSVGTIVWINPGNGLANDSVSTYINNPTAATSHYLKISGFGFSIPSNASIIGIAVYVKHWAGDINIFKDSTLKLIQNGNPAGNNYADASWWTFNVWETRTYGSSADLWGLTWTPAEINSGLFGVVLSAYTAGSTESGPVDCISVRVYYKLLRPYYTIDCSYQMQFTAAAKSDVSQLGWFVNGKMSNNASTIYLYDWGSSTWNTTGKTLTSSQGDVGQRSISVADYMATNGSVLIRFYLSGQTASFTLSVDFLTLDIIYALIGDTTPPDTPNLFYPINDQALNNGTLLVWNATSDDVGGSGISYYELQLSDGVKSALSFDGVNDYVNLGTRDLPLTMTVSMWVYIKTPIPAVWSELFTMSTWDVNLGISTSYALYWSITGTSGNNYAQADVSAYLNQWVLVTAISRPAGSGWTSQLWVNNVKLDERTYASFDGTKANTGPTCIGHNFGGGRQFYGDVARALVYDRVMTSTEISDFYVNKVPDSTAGSFYYYKFNEGSGSSLIDSSGNGYTATIIGATWTTFTDPTFGFLLPNYDKTTDRTWYQFGYGDLAFTEWYWRVRAVDKASNIGNWSAIRYFYQTADPQVYVVLRDMNNAAINEYLNLAAFNITYHRSIEDGAGVWNTLSPYMPVINMFSSETVNITVRDWLGNYIVNNQQYSYSPTILVNLDIWDVCIGNGADQMAYIIMRSGNVFLHQFTYRSDIHFLVIAQHYNLTIIYPAMGNAQVYYDLDITGDFGIKVSSNMVADLYSAADNWESLTGNVANIVTTINDVKTEIYSFGKDQASTRRTIGELGANVSEVANNANILNWIIVTFFIAMVIALVSIYSRIGTRKTAEDLDHFKVITNAVDRTMVIKATEMEKKNKEN